MPEKSAAKPDPGKLTALLAFLGFSMSDFFHDDGSLKSQLELRGRGSLPFTLADYHHQLTHCFKLWPPSERFAVFVEMQSQSNDDDIPSRVRLLLRNFLRAIVGSIDAGGKE
jgi:hypothetical protein